jgi:ubiquitin fusion degradation protein 1
MLKLMDAICNLFNYDPVCSISPILLSGQDRFHFVRKQLTGMEAEHILELYQLCMSYQYILYAKFTNYPTLCSGDLINLRIFLKVQALLRAITNMLTKGELLAAQKRLEKRLQESTEQAKRKERILQERLDRQRQRAEAEERDKAQRHLFQLQAEEAARLQREAELEANNGVIWHGELIAIPAPESLAQDKGIVRAADKVVLPPSAGRHLMDQNAYSNGPMFFELRPLVSSTNNSAAAAAAGGGGGGGPGGLSISCKTTAGLLEFSSAEGFISIPRKVWRCLFGPSSWPAAEDKSISNYSDGETTPITAAAPGPIAFEGCRLHVAYRKLPKGKHATFQPSLATFQQDARDVDVKEILENVLSKHSALTEGDWIEVQLPSTSTTDGTKVHDLKVVQAQPGPAISIIDTDLEAEILPSIETEEKIREEEERLVRLKAEMEREVAERAVAERERLEGEREKHSERIQLADKAASRLPPEPTTDDAIIDIVEVVVRLPDGSRVTRRCRKSDTLAVLFDAVLARGGEVEAIPAQFNLVQQYPRRMYDMVGSAGRTLEEVGLVGRKEMVFLEPR